MSNYKGIESINEFTQEVQKTITFLKEKNNEEKKHLENNNTKSLIKAYEKELKIFNELSYLKNYTQIFKEECCKEYKELQSIINKEAFIKVCENIENIQFEKMNLDFSSD